MEKVDREDIYPFLDNYYEEFDVEACVKKTKNKNKSWWSYFCYCFKKDKRMK